MALMICSDFLNSHPFLHLKVLQKVFKIFSFSYFWYRYWYNGGNQESAKYTFMARAITVSVQIVICVILFFFLYIQTDISEFFFIFWVEVIVILFFFGPHVYYSYVFYTILSQAKVSDLSIINYFQKTHSDGTYMFGAKINGSQSQHKLQNGKCYFWVNEYWKGYLLSTQFLS